jgi:predicted nucleotide-binding protein
MKVTTAKKLALLNEQITAARNGEPEDTDAWRAKTEVVLRQAVGESDQLVADFRNLRYSPQIWSTGTPDSVFDQARRRGVQRGIALLEAAITKVEIDDDLGADQPASADTRPERTEIFIVHGHDEGQKEAVARFVQDLTGKKPIILHERVSSSATIIEKLERYAETASYAIVIATGDDMGRLATDTDDRPRARQNVILELGYFFGALGRENVALLYETGLDRPSDTNGILHIELDGTRQWRVALANEMEAAGFEVDRGALT